MHKFADMSKDRIRNKGFAHTHQLMIEAAVRLISDSGPDALSIAGLARAMGVNRTTVYYHFESRDAMLSAVQHWASERLASALAPDAPQHERIDYITRFVVENPILIKLWIDDFISTSEIRSAYPGWDELVAGLRERPDMDAEVYAIILLTGSIIGPRIFRNTIDPDASAEAVVVRFRTELQRLLGKASLLRS